MDKEQLTTRQCEIFLFMMNFYIENDQLPPTHAIADYFGITLNAVVENQRRLEKKGYIEKNAVGKYKFA